jgi:hypothetical protein
MFVVACLAAASAAASASPAAATVTIGQVAAPTQVCDTGFDFSQPTVTSGNSYVVQGDGTITSWSHLAGAGAGTQQLKLKVFRPVAGLTYTVVGHDGPRTLVKSALNTFPTSIAVKAGDVLGLTTLSGGLPGCRFDAPGEAFYASDADHADGALLTFNTGIAGLRLNASAVIVPVNTFTFGGTKDLKVSKKGTATLTLNVPGPGVLTVSGNGAKAASTAGASATTTKSVAAAGKVKLKIKATGKKRKKLNRTGKVKLQLSVTYTPTGGSPGTHSTKLTLKKR